MALRLSYDYQALRGDVSSAVASTVVVLPWALAVGMASGLGPLAGLYGTIAIGFFAAVFGGTRAQQSDTSAPMFVAMTAILMQHAGNPAEAFTIVMLAGLMQIAMGALRLGLFIVYVPYSVIAGLMSGIGVLVVASQVLPMFGIAAGTAGVWADPLAHVDTDAAAVGAVTLAMCVFWPARAERFVSAYLVALVVGTVVAVVWFTDAPALGDFPTGLPTLHPPVLSPGFLAEAVRPAFLLALIGSINSLLSSLLHDSLTGDRHDSNRELAGQGLGNVAAGVLGALPGSASAVTTVFNIRAGTRTRVSGALRSVILLALVLGAGPIAEPIPVAALAVVAMKAGWDVIDWRFLTRIHRIQRDFAVVMLATLVLTIFFDLLTAVGAGFIISVLVRAREDRLDEMDSVVSVPLLDQAFLGENGSDDPFFARVGLLELRGAFSVASSRELIWIARMDIRDHEIVIFDFSKTTRMDDSAALAMEHLVGSAVESDTECIVVHLSGGVARTLNSLDVFRRLPKDRFVGDMDEARKLARNLLERRGGGSAS